MHNVLLYVCMGICDFMFIYLYIFWFSGVLPDGCWLTPAIFAAVDLPVCPEEQIFNVNQTDMDDRVGCENQDEEVEAMIEESPSGSDMFYFLISNECGAYVYY